jgi:predicted nucleic acid-binding Zn ribbon protein
MSSTTPDDWHDRCGHCGAGLPFSAPSYQKYCSVACRLAAWEEMLGATREARNAARRQARLEAKRDRPACLECGAPIPAEATLLRKFCSPRCEARNGQRRRYAREREVRAAMRAARHRDAAE